MAVSIVFETHSWSEDNDRGIATGWNQGRLAPSGRELAAELGERRSNDGIDLVFTSDLRRAVETAEIAFGSSIPVLHDWRLRECNYGSKNGMPAAELRQNRPSAVVEAYPDGESWATAVERVGWCVDDLLRYCDGQRVLVIGHVATYWGLEHRIAGTPLVDLMTSGFDWRLGWEFEFSG